MLKVFGIRADQPVTSSRHGFIDYDTVGGRIAGGTMDQVGIFWKHFF